jgi:hypothetical protein
VSKGRGVLNGAKKEGPQLNDDFEILEAGC